MIRRTRFLPLVLMLALALAGCDSAKTRAERHYKTAIALLAKGDIPRALVEFRAVFQLDSMHHDARAAYADVLRQQGNLREATGQYLRLLEDDPHDLTGNRALAEMALDQGNLDDARRYAAAAEALAPDDPAVRALGLSLRYRDAIAASDEPARAAAAAAAAALLTTDPAPRLARQIALDDRVRAQDWPGALAVIDAGLAVAPNARDLADARLAVLDRLGDPAATEAQLKAMIARFPADASLPPTLVRWYVARHQLDAAEAFLRARIDPANPDPAPRLALIGFLAADRSRDVARAELEKRLAALPPATPAADRIPLVTLHAGFVFDGGDPAAAIAELTALLAAPADTPAARTAADAARVTLARMRDATGDRAAALTQIDAVLAHDPNQPEATRLKAAWLIDADQTDAALVLLRSALGLAPHDADLMQLMARAYDRSGARDLEADMLARAVEAANHAADPTLGYAAFLLRDGKTAAAEQTLTAALALTPDDPRLIASLGAAHLAEADVTRATADADRLTALGTPAATTAANDLRARILAAQNRGADLVAFLDGLARAGGPGAAAADRAAIRAEAAQGNLDAALARAEALAAAAPDDPDTTLIHAAVLDALGRSPEARAMLQALLAQNDHLEAAWTALYRLTLKTDPATAPDVLARARAALPDSPTLRWIAASARETAGDTEAAITLYEALYAQNSDNPVIANNLASLLATARDDAASLARAATIASRLKGSDVPAFQDTWGWIALRRGEADAALTALEPAARGLPQDPSVQYHLGRAYAALGRAPEARARFQAAQALIAARTPATPAPAWQADLDARLAAPDPTPPDPTPPDPAAAEPPAAGN
jgi:tetratricopeptide (TPR) repeat protein